MNGSHPGLLDETKLDVETLPGDEARKGTPASPAPPRVPGFGRDTLIENYHAMIRAGAIYYPVAYQFLRELGHGRQGRVFLALRQGARGCITRHAIKLYDPSIYSSVEQYWTDMGRIASQISKLHTSHNPNLLGRDVFEEAQGVGYAQMEAIDGINLGYFLRGRHLERVRAKSTEAECRRYAARIFRIGPEKVAIRSGVAVYIMRQMLRGLEALHAKGFVHSDVKPTNIMLDRFGYIRLVDYGRATRDGEKARILLGSPMYMAPEVHDRQPGMIQSDLYSVGLVGLEMLRGQPLTSEDLNEEELLEIKLKLLGQLPELLPEPIRRNDVLVSILMRLLEPDPARRWNRAADVESGESGLSVIHKQLIQSGRDSEYGRELEEYLAKLVDSRTDMVENPELDDELAAARLS